MFREWKNSQLWVLQHQHRISRIRWKSHWDSSKSLPVFHSPSRLFSLGITKCLFLISPSQILTLFKYQMLHVCWSLGREDCHCVTFLMEKFRSVCRVWRPKLYQKKNQNTDQSFGLFVIACWYIPEYSLIKQFGRGNLGIFSFPFLKMFGLFARFYDRNWTRKNPGKSNKSFGLFVDFYDRNFFWNQ